MRPLPYLVLLITLTFASDHDTSHDIKHEHKNGQEEEDSAKAQAIAPANMHFAVNLYKHIASKSGSSAQNIFFSPVSISTAFAMLSIGAKSATHRQIIEGLSLNQTQIEEEKIHEAFEHLLLALNKPKSELQVSIGNALFVGDKVRILKSFAHEVEHHYHAAVISANFENPEDAGKQINDYVKNKTNGKIEELVRDLDEDTKMVLVNYVFFKGKWLYPFNPSLTETDTFFIDKYNSVKVPMMYKADKVSSMFDRTLSCTVLKLPYRGSAHMLIVMPEKDGDFVTLEDHLTKELVDTWLANMKTRKTDIFFPKFKLDQKYQLKTFLQELGIKDIFTGRANLTGLTDERNIKLTEITQRAVIEIDERGTEASAATGSEIVAFSLPPTIKVDHPFLLMIYEETHKTLLFIGRVVDPTKF
ncbi:alpha-1-antiproteinase-like [Ascaphus truei]|uniref:alpha-1-antiproteinase-like n=1 Tax=Ascaphus truei TaxID=8439 RepID=UPI003F5ABD41